MPGQRRPFGGQRQGLRQHGLLCRPAHSAPGHGCWRHSQLSGWTCIHFIAGGPPRWAHTRAKFRRLARRCTTHADAVRRLLSNAPRQPSLPFADAPGEGQENRARVDLGPGESLLQDLRDDRVGHGDLVHAMGLRLEEAWPRFSPTGHATRKGTAGNAQGHFHRSMAGSGKASSSPDYLRYSRTGRPDA